MRIISENLKNEFIKLLTQTSDSIYIISPYIKSSQVEMLSRYLPEHVNVNILTTFESESFYQKASDPEFVIILKKNFSNIEIRVNKKLHAKIYLFDRKTAIVTSANFTQSGFDDNIEYSILLKQKDWVKKIADDVSDMFRHSCNLYDILDDCQIVRGPQIFNRTPEEINTILKKITATKFNPQERSEYQQIELIKTTSTKGYYIHYNEGATFVKLGDELTLSNDYELKDKYKIIGFRTYEVHFNGLTFEINVKEVGKNNYENNLKFGDEILCEFYKNDEGKWISYKTEYQGLSFIDYDGLEMPYRIQRVNVIAINGMLLYFDKGALNVISLKEKGSDAFKAGVKNGCKLTSFDNQKLEVDTNFEAYQELKRYEGRSIIIEVTGSDKRIISFKTNFREVKFKYMMLKFINLRTRHKSELLVARIENKMLTEIKLVIKLQSINTFEELEITETRLEKGYVPKLVETQGVI